MSTSTTLFVKLLLKNVWTLILSFAIFARVFNADANNLMHLDYNRINFKGDQRATIISNIHHDCIFVTSKTGYFKYYSKTTKETVCGIYLMADTEKFIEVTFTDFDVPCDSENGVGNLVQYVNGWELNGEIFPSPSNLSDRSFEESQFCSNKTPVSKTFASSQNSALISYRITEIGRGFTIFVKHKKNSSPCNMIHTDEPYAILKSNENQRICSLWAPYPVAFKVNAYSLGDPRSIKSTERKCTDFSNRIEIGGGGLDTNHIEILDAICNQPNLHGEKEAFVLCSTTTIKLISDGLHENFLNISMRSLSQDEILSTRTKYRCSLTSIN